MPSKASKISKQSSKKETPDMEFACKFRGKYDLNKAKSNSDINHDNAVNLFELIYKKNEKLYRDTHIKVFMNKRMFEFGDKRAVGKVRHRVPFSQVSKFFVFHKDPTMLVMGVHHKAHKWFLVFHFNNVEELNKFCDAIEGDKKNKDVEQVTIDNNIPDENTLTVPQISVDVQDGAERCSIHSEMHNKDLTITSFEDNFGEPDLEPEYSFREEFSPALSSSRNSWAEHEFDEDLHCDDLARSKLLDLMMKPGKYLYSDTNRWNEQLDCFEYPNENSSRFDDNRGPIYLYCAHRKANYQFYDEFDEDYSSNEEVEINEYKHFKPKKITSFYDGEQEDTEGFKHYQAKFQRKPSDEGYNHYAPKLLSVNH